MFRTGLFLAIFVVLNNPVTCRIQKNGKNQRDSNSDRLSKDADSLTTTTALGRNVDCKLFLRTNR